MRNLVINGDMRVDQRNEGASLTVPATGAAFRSVDKFFGVNSAVGVTSLQRLAATPPTGFTNYLRSTVTTADATPAAGAFYAVLTNIESFLIQASNFGLSTAANISLSFWVRSSVAQQMSGALKNSANNRSYIFNYTINTANVWQYVTVVIPGDSAGTWLLSGNGVGIRLEFTLGCGSTTTTPTAGVWVTGNFLAANNTSGSGVILSNGATLDIAGVQLEVANASTSFDYQQYETQLALCQRYYSKSFLQGTTPAQNVGVSNGETYGIGSTVTGTSNYIFVRTPVTMRAVPGTLVTYNPGAANAQVRNEIGGVDCSSTAIASTGDEQIIVTFNPNAAGAIGNLYGVHWTADADL